MNLSNCSLNLCELLARTTSCGSVCPCSNYELCKDAPTLGAVSCCHLLLPTPAPSTHQHVSQGAQAQACSFLWHSCLLSFKRLATSTQTRNCCIQDKFLYGRESQFKRIDRFCQLWSWTPLWVWFSQVLRLCIALSLKFFLLWPCCLSQLLQQQSVCGMSLSRTGSPEYL